MSLLPPYRADLSRVVRFSLQARIAHWGHAVTFLLCFFSGLPLFFKSHGLAIVFGGMAGASLVHRVSAVGLMAFVLYYSLVGFRSMWRWAREVGRFGKRDLLFLLTFPGKFFGYNKSGPPQTKLNGGEKLNSIVSSTCVLVLIVSGVLIWAPEAFNTTLVQWAYLAHAVAMIVSTTLVFMHAYLGSLHPVTGESFWGMWKGTVRADWAKKHHALWYEEVSKQD